MRFPAFPPLLAVALLAGALAPPAPVFAAAIPAAKKPAKVLPFIEDDWPRAVAEAKARHLPLFVELWAPW